MHFELMDKNVSTTMNVFIIFANIINLLYNIPQIVTTYKRKSTKDFSGWFLFLRFIGNFIWVAYAIEIDSLLMLINNIVTILSSAFIGYYKIKEIYNEYKLKQYKLLSSDIINDESLILNNNNIIIDNNTKYESLQEIILHDNSEMKEIDF
jgi:uncharacterized protein with PQ loop repeat